MTSEERAREEDAPGVRQVAERMFAEACKGSPDPDAHRWESTFMTSGPSQALVKMACRDCRVEPVFVLADIPLADGRFGDRPVINLKHLRLVGDAIPLPRIGS